MVHVGKGRRSTSIDDRRRSTKKNRRSYKQIFKIVCIQLAPQNRRARVNVNATHASPCQKKQFSKTLILINSNTNKQYSITVELTETELAHHARAAAARGIL